MQMSNFCENDKKAGKLNIYNNWLKKQGFHDNTVEKSNSVAHHIQALGL